MATPLVLSPASPAELLRHIVSYETYPTTLLICTSRADFTASLIEGLRDQQPKNGSGQDQPSEDAQIPSPLLSAPLYQVAVARHIRILFIPTVTHLRAYLSVFTPRDAKIQPPPLPPLGLSSAGRRARPPLLVAYGFLDVHRDSSEWSAQGISDSAAALVESARRNAFRATIVEPRGSGGHEDFGSLLAEIAPVLSGGVRREEGGWTGRTLRVDTVLRRWFRFQTGQWDAPS